MEHMEMTVKTAKTYSAAIDAVVEAAERNGFKVQAIHDVSGTLAERGFEREPLTIIEACNARYAHAVLERDVRIGLMLPCPLMVYEQRDQVFISTMRPTAMTRIYPRAEVGGISVEVERILSEIIHEAAV